MRFTPRSVVTTAHDIFDSASRYARWMEGVCEVLVALEQHEHDRQGGDRRRLLITVQPDGEVIIGQEAA